MMTHSRILLIKIAFIPMNYIGHMKCMTNKHSTITCTFAVPLTTV